MGRNMSSRTLSVYIYISFPHYYFDYYHYDVQPQSSLLIIYKIYFQGT